MLVRNCQTVVVLPIRLQFIANDCRVTPHKIDAFEVLPPFVRRFLIVDYVPGSRLSNSTVGSGLPLQIIR